MMRFSLSAGARLLVMAVAAFGFGAPTQGADDEPDAPSADELKARLRLAGEHVRRFELRSVSGGGLRGLSGGGLRGDLGGGPRGGDAVIELIDQPLLAYGDSARVNNNGTLWAWGKTGRPVAFMELFQGSEKEDRKWVHAVTLTSSERVVLVTPDTGRWQPPRMPLEPALLPGAPPPAEKAPARLRQLKDLARRFTAHEFWDPDNSRFELRVLVQPVQRYDESAASIQDGAAFVIAHGTNPEAILLIEALGTSMREAHWHYSLARSSHAEAHVEFDGQEVWECQRAGNGADGPDKSYWLFASPVEGGK
jgi:hypothetical protein